MLIKAVLLHQVRSTQRIPVGKSYYRHQDTEERFCWLDCLTDWLIYSYAVSLETNDRTESSEDDDDE